MEWHGTKSPQKKKARVQKSLVKTMLIADAVGIAYREFVPKCATLNIHCYLGMLELLDVRMRHVTNG